MPELPEVEVTRRSVAGGLLGARVRDVQMGLPLRWPLGRDPRALVGTACGEMSRRGKYLWLPLSQPVVEPARHLPGLPSGGDAPPPQPAGGLLIHLGMSGALAFGDAPAERGPYDHFRLVTDRGCLWLTDPRRFGAVVWSPALDAEPARKLLAALGPEPFDPALDEAGFHAGLKARRTPVKAVLLSGELVVGAGNIYACEALHVAKLSPTRRASTLATRRGEPKPETLALVKAIRRVLEDAIAHQHRAGGDDRFRVYDHEGQRCPRRGCPGMITRIVQAGRSTFFCPVCQK